MVLIEGIASATNGGSIGSILVDDVDMEKLCRYVQEHELSDDDTKTLLAKLQTWLDITTPIGPLKSSSLNLAALLFAKTAGNDQLSLLRLLSLYMNPHVSWSNAYLAQAATLSAEVMAPHIPQFFDHLKPHLLNIRNPKLTTAGYKKSAQKAMGLQPSLGLRYSAASEESKRNSWKNSDDVKSLSWIVPLIVVGKRWPGFDSSWPIVTTFMINVLDDSDTEFRTIGCHLLKLFLDCCLGDVLLKSGLVRVFWDSVEASLSFLPSLTPAVKSLRLLSVAYPTLSLLAVLNKAKPIDFVMILDKNILGLITHVHGRGNDEGAHEVLAFLLEQIGNIVTHHIKASVLVCLSRLLFTLNQLIINPFLIDADNGLKVVNAALKGHKEILEAFLPAIDLEASKLVLLYKYDFIGSWAILGKRCVKFGVGDSQTKILVKGNVELLRKIAEISASESDLEEDLRETCARVSEFLEYVY